MGSKSTITVNAGLILVATFIFGGWASFFIAIVPFFAVPIAFFAGAVVYGAFEVIGGLLQAIKRLSLPNLLAIVSTLCIPLGFLPIGAYSGRHPFPSELLLEEYALSFLYYAFLLHLMCAIWWYSRDKQHISPTIKLDKYDALAVILLLTAPYYVFGVAQTSKLHAAAKSGEVANVAAALKPWKSVDSYSGTAGTPLGIAIGNNDKDVASFLLGKGASVRLRRRDGQVIDHLEKAIRYRKRELIELLVPYADNTSLTNALVPAVNYDDAYTINLLIDNGAKVDDGESLYFAARQGNADLVRLLLSRAEKPRMVADTGWHGVNYFTLEKKTSIKIELSETLLAYGADITKAADLLKSTLYQSTPDITFVAFLLKKGCPPNGSYSDYITPLERAVRLGSVDLVRLLLKHGADPNFGAGNCSIAVRCTNRTTAMYEAATGSEEIAALLLAHGGDVTVVNKQNKTPLDEAVRKENMVVAELFREASVRQRRIRAEEIQNRKKAERRRLIVPPNCTTQSTKGGGSYTTTIVCDEKREPT